jgi:oligopeptide transport system substrate-binding protein
VSSSISRRHVLAAPLALASCRKHEPYFGKATPPTRQSLIYEIGGEPTSLDPATSLDGFEFYVMPALFEGLVSRDPDTLEPRAALATHYKIEPSLTELTFFLRGHPNPAGTKLPGANAAPNPASWSDGRPVTAHDFVYSWRRVADPANAGAYASSLYAVANGKEISEGKLPPEKLGIGAVDDYTLRVSLKDPAPHFLKVASMEALAATPRHAVSARGSSWTEACRMPSCGPFLLHEWKPYDRIVLRKNTRYYDARRVLLEEIVFLPIIDGVTGVNLYKTGSAYAMHGREVPPLWIPALRDRKDFHAAPAYRTLFYAFNTTRAPFDNRLVRWAFQMATNKDEIARFLSGGQRPARTVVPPFFGYQGIETLPVRAGERVWDVSSYDPQAGRELLAMAGSGRLVIDLTFPNRTRSKEMAQILQKQWRANLRAEINLVMQDWTVWARTVSSVNYQGVIEAGTGANYADPNSFFEYFVGRYDGSGWSDQEFNRMVDQANAEAQNAARMRKLAACEERLLRAMPVLPVFFDSYSYLQKPYVTGLRSNVLDVPEFRDAWIDTNWRPS